MILGVMSDSTTNNGTTRTRRREDPAPSSPAAAPVALAVDPVALGPLVRAVVAETLAAVERDQATIPDGEFCFTEEEAARLLKLASHQLRDERLRGRITASKIVGGRIRYTREDLLAYLEKNRVDAKE